jgi:hypothetical protein
MELDIEECDKIFRATGATVRKRDIRFCRKIGEKGQEKRSILVGMKTKCSRRSCMTQQRH